MNQPIRRLSMVVAVMFVLLLVASTWIQVLGAQGIREASDNRRTQLDSYARERGQILLGGQPIARSTEVEDDLEWQRVYSDPELYSHVTGYFSFTYGSGAGLESASDGLLSGRDDQLFYDRLTDTIAGREPRGASLELTIDPDAQQAAEQALGEQRGAVVALDPSTGDILAMVSHPNFDPSPLASHDVPTERAAWERYTEDETQPMVNRAIGGNLYPPGSTFKIVTAAAALESGDYSAGSSIPGPATLDLPQTTSDLPNASGAACGANDQVTLAVAMQDSCNTAFGWLGMELGGDAVAEQAEAFGFGEELSVPMTVAPSTFPTGLNPPQEAQSAIGQYDVRTTPMQMAMVTAAVANDGVVMRPNMIEQVMAADTSVIDEPEPDALRRAISSDTASELTDMMQLVTTDGTGTAGAVDGVSVAAKTGTAQHAEGAAPHAWYTAFAPADNPQVAVAVVVESGGTAGSEASGGSSAGPISKAVMEAVLQ